MKAPLIVSVLSMIVLLAVKIAYLPPQIPLFFSLPVGEDQLGEWWMIFLFPILMFLLVFINSRVSSSFFPHNSFVNTMIKYINLTLIVVLSFVFIRIIILVT